MQSNTNKEDKRIVEIWEWKDTPWQYSPGIKKCYRRLRRKRQKRILEKDIEESLLSFSGINDSVQTYGNMHKCRAVVGMFTTLAMFMF